MTDTNSKKPLAYLDTEGTVHALWHKLKKVEQLHAVVSKHLDNNLQAYCKVTSFINGKLTIVAANSSITSQLHFQSPELLRKLKQEASLQGIQTIQCKVQVQTNRSRRALTKPRTVKPLSAESASIIADIAETIEDSKLRAAMQRLAKNVKAK